jgi:hypothetical protein
MADIPQKISSLKDELLALMRANAVTRLRVEYSGSGDDGCIDCIQAEPAVADAQTSKALDEQAERLTEALINEYHGGFENNDGGCGVVVVDANSGQIEYERTDYYTESSSEQMVV